MGHTTAEIEKRLVCYECLGDYALKNFIRQKGARGRCHYCGRDRKSLPLASLMAPLREGVLYAYQDAEGSLAAGEDRPDTTWSSQALVFEELAESLGVPDDVTLLDDIAALLGPHTIWCRADPFGEREEDAAFYSWNTFSTLVKTQVRYVFYKVVRGDETDRAFQPARILETIGGYVEQVNLVRELTPQSRSARLFRGRTHAGAARLARAEDFGPPPPHKAAANRMSPEGIAMFYGALDADTALAEIYTDSSEWATVAEFRLSGPLRVIDFTKPNWLNPPSLFDEERRERRSPLLFLKRFSTDLSKRDAVHNAVEYVPTQIVTEYFRHIYRDSEGRGVDGLLYHSARRPGGKCIVLFLQSEDCTEWEDREKGRLYTREKRITRYRKGFRPQP